MNYMVATSSTTNNANTDTYVNNIDSREHLEAFHYVLNPLLKYGWKFVIYESNHISINKKFHELEEITIEYKNNCYHFTLPLNNSIFSYYKKLHDLDTALNYLNSYVINLV